MTICSKCGVEIGDDSVFCKKCGSRQQRPPQGTLDQKKARVLAEETKGINLTALATVAVIVVLSGMVLYAVYGYKTRTGLFKNKTGSFHATTARQGTAYVKVREVKGEVHVSLKDMDDGMAHFYAYALNGKEIKFFLMRDGKGGVRAALDACNACYRTKLGYRHEGDFVICNNCGMSFKPEEIGVITGGCNPIPVEKRVNGQIVVLKSSDLAAGAKYF